MSGHAVMSGTCGLIRTLVAGGIMALAYIGALILLPEHLSMGRHAGSMQATLGLDTHKARPVGTAASSARARPEEPAATMRLQPETSSACQRCKGRCSLFASSPICCTAQCSRICPNLLAGFGCSVLAETQIDTLALECEQCEQACYTGVACCERRVCWSTCERTQSICARAGYGDDDSNDDGRASRAASGTGLLGLAASASGGAQKSGRDGVGGGGDREPGAGSFALRLHATASLSELEGGAAICAACADAIRTVGPEHGCTTTCVAGCPQLAHAQGCAPESANLVCYQCRSACSLLGTATLPTKLMCCRDECISACPATMASYACPGAQLDTAAQLARRFGVAPSVFGDGATAAFCEGCLSACSASAASDGCCSPLCAERCAVVSQPPERPLPSCGRPAASAAHAEPAEASYSDSVRIP